MTQTFSIDLVSASAGGVEGDASSTVFGEPSISADGRYISFYSNASNLVSGDTNGTYDVFVKDLPTSWSISSD